MARLNQQGADLVPGLSPLEKLAALREDVRVALTAVHGIDLCHEPFRELRGIRAPGTAVPGRLALGTWRYGEDKDFVAL